jgi:hypothetical protein
MDPNRAFCANACAEEAAFPNQRMASLKPSQETKDKLTALKA